MAEEIKFDVFHFSGEKVHRVQFTIPWESLSFHNFMWHIIKECDSETKKLETHFLPILYIDITGDHVQLNRNENEYLKFLDFIRQSKDRGHEFVHLIIPNIGNEKNKPYHSDELRSICRGGNELDLRNLNNLFSVKINREKSSRIEEALSDSSANVVLTHPSLPWISACPEPSQNQDISSTYGLLDVKFIPGHDLPRLLKNGSRILVPTDDGNYLQMSFSKDHTYAPYRFFLWRNSEEEHRVPEYRCQELKIPTCIDKNGFCISDESKSLLAKVVIDDQNSNTKRMGQEFEQREDDEVLQQKECASPTKTDLDHGHEGYTLAWLHRYLEKLKTDIVSDVKKDLREDVKQMISFHYEQQNVENDDFVNKNQKNSTSEPRLTEEQGQHRSMKEGVEDWEIVKEFTKDERNLHSRNRNTDNDCCHGKDKYPSDDIRDSKRESNPLRNGSDCTREDSYDSDSSVSLILDDSLSGKDGDDIADDKSSFVEIPRCFVTQIKDTDENTLGNVPVRVKRRRARKTLKSLAKLSSPSQSGNSSEKHTKTAPVMKLIGEAPRKLEIPESSANSSQSQTTRKNKVSREARREQISVDKSNGGNATSAHRPNEKEEAGVSSAESFFFGKTSDDNNSRNTEPGQTKPVNILPDKVFEMTNNVFKNVLNSVKIPHSNEVKESVQKVFEESMYAASRLIPNPLLVEGVPLPEDRNVPFENSATGNATPSPNTTSNVNVDPQCSHANENSYDVLFDDLSDKQKADLRLLNEMGFVNNGHNLFLLSTYPNDLEKVVESLVNFTVL